MTTYTFTVRAGVGTVDDAYVIVDGARFDVDAALAAGSGGGTPGTSFKTTDDNLASALTALRAGSGALLDVNGVSDGGPTVTPAKYAVMVDPTVGAAGVVPVKQADGSFALAVPSESDSALATRAAVPDQLLVGTITRNSDGVATAANVAWPDGATGTYVGTPSASFPAVDSWVITHVLAGTTKTFTQPTMTRDANGGVTSRPAITVT